MSARSPRAAAAETSPAGLGGLVVQLLAVGREHVLLAECGGLESPTGRFRVGRGGGSGAQRAAFGRHGHSIPESKIAYRRYLECSALRRAVG